jgi:hypothetical protein
MFELDALFVVVILAVVLLEILQNGFRGQWLMPPHRVCYVNVAEH